MTHTDFRVRYTTINRKDEVVTKEKSFKTKAARDRWLNNDDNGVVQVLATSDPQ